MASSSTRNFNGSSDYIDSGDSSSFDATSGELSVGAWVNWDALAVLSMFVVGNVDGSSNGWNYRYNPFLSPQTELFIQGTTATAALTQSATQWYYMGFSWDIGTDQFFIQIDDTGSVSTDTASNTTTPTASSNSLKIGQEGNGVAFADGHISHVQIWDRKITQHEHECAAFRPGSVTRNLQSYYPIYGQQSPEVDIGPLQNNGTVTGTTAVSLAIPFAIPTSR